MSELKDIRLVRVYAADMEQLKKYVRALYEHDEAYDEMVHIEEGVSSLLRNPELATAYFVKRNDERIGYVILTRYHSVERGGVTMYIDELYVEDSFRRSGVGKVVLEKIVEIAKAAGARGLSAQAETFNTAAQEFFRSQSFDKAPYHYFERRL